MHGCAVSRRYIDVCYMFSVVNVYLDHLKFCVVCINCRRYVMLSLMTVMSPPPGSKRHSLQAVELSQWTQAAVQIVSNLPAPSNGGTIYRFLGMSAMRTRWMAGAAAHKSG